MTETEFRELQREQRECGIGNFSDAAQWCADTLQSADGSQCSAFSVKFVYKSSKMQIFACFLAAYEK